MLFESRNQGEAWMSKNYAAGLVLNVFYNPENPADAVLEPGSWKVSNLVAALIILGVGRWILRMRIPHKTGNSRNGNRNRAIQRLACRFSVTIPLHEVANKILILTTLGITE